MKYSDILFEKTCVNLYIQKHCTMWKMMEGEKGRELYTETCRWTGKRTSRKVTG